MPLQTRIIETIRANGPLSFHDFMEMALYYPCEGYYAASGEKLGERGDFYTSPYLSELFGEMVARQLEEMWHHLHRRSFTIVECGAGPGLLCRDVLRHLRNNPEMFDHLQYIIIEKSESMRQRERTLLTADGLLPKLKWLRSLRDCPHINGCILSNELVDNFAVHQVVMEDQLMEVYVDYNPRTGFIETLQPAPGKLKDYLSELQIALPTGYHGEINLEATDWIREVSSVLASGFVLTIDYGYTATDLYSRPSGTLACYHQHQVHDNPYDNIGEQDITTHVNFSALDHWGRRNGLESCGYTNQARFLQGLGLTARLHHLGATGQQQLRTLLLDMGNKFKVLIQRKGLHRVFLSGLQFAQILA